MLHFLIMAGGSGTRFWPESRARRPKQFLPLSSPGSMIRTTVDRLGPMASPERVWVATTAPLVGQVVDQLPEVPVESIVVEPCGRNTAPCIGLAAMMIAQRDPEATMAVMPSDHVIDPPDEFRCQLAAAAELLEEEPDWLITFGIRPTYPAESFGYIERGESYRPAAVALGLESESESPIANLPVYRVRQFREKPSVERAKQFLARGTFYWNAGIFVWRARTVLAALERHQPELFGRLKAIESALGTPHAVEVLRREFAAMTAISIDYAVLEHSTEVLMIEAAFPWDDLGSWQGLMRLQGGDDQGNVVSAKHVGLSTSGSLIRSSTDHLIATIGVRDLIIVHTPDATLVANKHDEESVRQLVAELKSRGWEEYL